MQTTLTDSSEIAQLQTLLAAEPSNTEARRKLAALFDERGEPENAVQEYRAILQYAPDNDSVRLDLITDLTDLGKLEEAEDELRKMSDPKLDESSWWVDVGDAYLKQGLEAKAVAAYCEAVELNPNQVQARNNLRQIAPQVLAKLPISSREWLTRLALVGLSLVVILGIISGVSLFWIQNAQAVQEFWASIFVRRIVLQADKPLTQAELETSAQVLENRLDLSAGFSPVFHIQPPDKLVGEISPSEEITTSVLTISQNPSLEFVDIGDVPLKEGTRIETSGVDTAVAPGTPIPLFPKTDAAGQKIYRTIMTNADLDSAYLEYEGNNPTPVIVFTLTPRGRAIFADYTSTHVGKYLGVALDKEIIAMPGIDSPIPGGKGVIRGNFTHQQEEILIMRLTIKRLPAQFRIVRSEVVPFFMP